MAYSFFKEEKKGAHVRACVIVPTPMISIITFLYFVPPYNNYMSMQQAKTCSNYVFCILVRAINVILSVHVVYHVRRYAYYLITGNKRIAMKTVDL